MLPRLDHSLLLETWVSGKPSVQTPQGAFAERERRVWRILDLRNRSPANSGKNGELGTVELAVRELCAQEE